MRLALAAALVAAPALADETSMLGRDCMEVLGPMVYGPETYGSGVWTGIVIGYGLARGLDEEGAQEAGAFVGAACRNNPGMTFGEALAAIPHGNGPSTTR